MDSKDLTRHMIQYFRKNKKYSAIHYRRNIENTEMQKSLTKLVKMSYDCNRYKSKGLTNST